MRLLLLSEVVAMLATPFASARSEEVLTPEQAQTSYTRYYTEVNTMVMHVLSPELVKHSERLRPGSLQITFRVNRPGKISNLRVGETGGNQFAQQSAVRVLRELRLPPIPKNATEGERHPWVDIHIDLDIPATKYIR